MATVRGCNLPDDLLYDVQSHIWFHEVGDGNLKVGKSCATVQSGKWVDPAGVAAAGTVVEINEALAANPSIANDDPYGRGWLIILKPEDWASVKPTLVPGTQVAGPYEAKMAADGFAGCGP